MTRRASPGLGVLLVLLMSAPGLAQLKPEVIERGKKATALVVVSNAVGWTGSAFCVDPSGLFVTNAHVVERATEGGGSVRLVVDSGLATQQSLRATVLR